MVLPLPPPPGSTGGAGWTQPVPFSQTQAGLAFANQQQLGLLAIQRQNEETLARQQQRNALEIQAREQAFIAREAERQRSEQAKIRREDLARQRQESLNQLQLDREQTFADLMKSGDQVRAVLFASGFGPESQLFDVRARQLGTSLKALRGAKQLEQTTESALSVKEKRRVSRLRGMENSSEACRPPGSCSGPALRRTYALSSARFCHS